MKKNGLKVAVWYVALIAVVIVVISLLYGGGSKTELTYGDIVKMNRWSNSPLTTTLPL